MKTIVYSVITGNYDQVVELNKKEEDIEYILFTNNNSLTSDTWNIKYIDENIDNILLSRKIKILSYKYLPKHELSIYIDSGFKINCNIKDFLDKECELDKYDMIGFKHKYRDCIYDEINTCVQLNKETIEKVKVIEKFLKKENYPKHNGLTENGILVRKNIKQVNDLMDKWYYMVETYSTRDQLSFCYSLWKNPIKYKAINMHIIDNQYFKHIGHCSTKEINYRLLFEDSLIFNYKNARDEKTIINNEKVSITSKCIKDTDKIVLILKDEIKSIISNININVNKTKIKVYNSISIKNNYVFNDIPIILFEGNFTKNEIIKISFNIKNDNNQLVTEEINKLREDLKDEQEKNRVLENEYLKITNSKGWKLLEKIRKIRKTNKIQSGGKNE